MRQRFYVNCSIQSPERYRDVPCAMDLDFRGSCPAVDANSLRFVRMDGKAVPFYLSDSFLWNSFGRISFLVEDTDFKEYRIYYDEKENGPWQSLAWAGSVGDGDPLRFNCKKPLPLCNGMTGEGHFCKLQPDKGSFLITPQVYGYLRDREWHVLSGYRRLANGLFGESEPLRCEKDGKIELVKGASAISVCNYFNGTGEDLLTTGYHGGPGEIFIYRREESFDQNGLPFYRYAGSLWAKDGYISALSAVWEQGEIIGLLIARSLSESYENAAELWFKPAKQEQKEAKWPRWGIRSILEFYPLKRIPGKAGQLLEPIPISVDGRILNCSAHQSFTLIWNPQTKLQDLLLAAPNGDYGNYAEKSTAYPVLYRNTGHEDNGCPVYRKGREYPQICDRIGMTVIFHPEYGLLRSAGELGGQFLRYPLEEWDEEGSPIFGPPKPLLQANPYLYATSGYAAGAATEDGSILSGCEAGRAVLLKNKLAKTTLSFCPPELMQTGGREIRLANGAFDDGGSLAEAPLGQTSAYLLRQGLFVKCGRRNFWFSRKSGEGFAAPVELRTVGGNPLGGHRGHPAIGPITGDQSIDLICDHDEGDALYLYRGTWSRDRILFSEGEPLFYDDGTKIKPSDWHSYHRHFSANLFSSDETYDLFVSACDKMLILRNTGARASPVFAKPERIMVEDGRPFTFGHHICLPFLADLFHNGVPEMVISGESGMFYLLRKEFLKQTCKKLTIALHWDDAEREDGPLHP